MAIRMNKATLFAILAIFAFAFFSGCTTTKEQSDNASLSQNTIETFSCPDGTIVENISSCPKCPALCNDSNPCTEDICNKDTGFKCYYKSLNGSQLGCSGNMAGCKEMSCSAGKCVKQNRIPCCGNGIAETSETCGNCETDVKCNSNQSCCSDSCVLPACKNDSDCNDNNILTKDSCVGIGCNAHCTVNTIKECKNGDGICPAGCSAFVDGDCPTYSLGQFFYDGGYRLRLSSNPINKHCYTEYDSSYVEDSDYGNYMVIDLTVNNIGNKTGDYISYSDFGLINSDGKQYDSTGFILGESCEDSNVFEVGSLYPGVTKTGQIWFDLGDSPMQTGSYKIIYDPNMFIDGDEKVIKFTIS